jgi:hypothetical protein
MVDCLAVPDTVDTMRLHPTKPCLAIQDDGEHVLTIFLLCSTSPCLFSSPSLSILIFCHFPSSNIISLDVEGSISYHHNPSTPR